MKIIPLITVFVASTTADSIYPLAFFAMIKNELVPLEHKQGEHFNYFSSRKWEQLFAKFTLSDGFAYTLDTQTPGYAGFQGPVFVFGNPVVKTRFEFDIFMRITNHDFYICDHSYNRARSILNMKLFGDSCTKTEIFLLPFSEDTHAASRVAGYATSQCMQFFIANDSHVEIS